MFLPSPHRLLSVTESFVVLPPNVRELIANITTNPSLRHKQNRRAAVREVQCLDGSCHSQTCGLGRGAMHL